MNETGEACGLKDKGGGNSFEPARGIFNEAAVMRQVGEVGVEVGVIGEQTLHGDLFDIAVEQKASVTGGDGKDGAHVVVVRGLKVRRRPEQ